MLIAIMMGALTAFFISSTATVRMQGGRQIASQLDNDAIDRARNHRPALVIAGRD